MNTCEENTVFVRIGRFRKFISKVSALATSFGDQLQLRGFKPGGTAGQVPRKINGTDWNWIWANLGWTDVTNKPTTFTPSAHTHPISQVTGLQTALDGKATVVTKTITPGGTVGDVTINTQAGTINVAPADTLVTVTNSLVNANSIVLCFLRTQDSTAVLDSAVPAAGSFTLRLSVSPTAETSVGFLVI